ncbi:MAG: hypothetical protein AAFZ15_16445 [Bacteroidota bacterium]
MFLLTACQEDDSIFDQGNLLSEGQVISKSEFLAVLDHQEGVEGLFTDFCNCKYRIIDTNASPFSFGDPNGKVDYYLTGTIPNNVPGQPSGCAGSFDSCTGGTCFEMSAYGSGEANGCQCFDAGCTDFVFDDGSRSAYPTAVLDFNCEMPKYESFAINWQPLWMNPNCAGIDLVALGSTITFEVICEDQFEEPIVDECHRAYSTGPITLMMEDHQSNPAPSVDISLEGCGCRPRIGAKP